jgi:hypothetical protein
MDTAGGRVIGLLTWLVRPAKEHVISSALPVPMVLRAAG